MPEKLKLIDHITGETGMQMGLIGFLVCFAGVALAFMALPGAGYWIGVIGALIFFLGMAIHFIKNWREIFHVDRP